MSRPVNSQLISRLKAGTAERMSRNDMVLGVCLDRLITRKIHNKRKTNYSSTKSFVQLFSQKTVTIANFMFNFKRK